MARTKLTVRRLSTGGPNVRKIPPWMCNKNNNRARPRSCRLGNKRITKQQDRQCKIEKLLPQQKKFRLKKNGQVIRTITLRENQLILVEIKRIENHHELML